MSEAPEKTPENTTASVQVNEASFTARVKPTVNSDPVINNANVDFAARLSNYKTTHRKENVVFAAVAQGVHAGVSVGAIGMLLNSGKQYMFAHGSTIENGQKIFKFSKTSLHKWVKWPALIGAAVGMVMGGIRATNHNNKMDTMQFAEMLEAQRAAAQANDQQPQMAK